MQRSWFVAVAVGLVLPVLACGDGNGDGASDGIKPRSTTTVPAPDPVTREEVEAVSFAFGAGVDALPPACHAYWEMYAPAEQGFGPDDSGIEIVPDSVTIADVDGDGVDDGLAAFYCTTAGTIPPAGMFALLAAGREVVPDDGRIDEMHEQQFGDPRNRVAAPFEVDTEGKTHLVVTDLRSYRSTDPNAGGSHRGRATFELRDGTLAVVSLEDLGAAPN